MNKNELKKVEFEEQENHAVKAKLFLNNQIIGTAQLRLFEKICFIEEGSIQIDYQNHGYGSYLFQEIINFLTTRKCREVRLYIVGENNMLERIISHYNIKNKTTQYSIKI